MELLRLEESNAASLILLIRVYEVFPDAENMIGET